jgi:hemin uptake protein HemP
MSERRPPSANVPGSESAPPAPAPSTISSETLFAPGQREVVIEHGGERYRLRVTRNGKLILTK